MQQKSEELYRFLLGKAKMLTEDWYASLDKQDASGVYASTDEDVIETLKEQNYTFHLHLCKLFVEDEQEFHKDLEPWINSIAQDAEHQSTPIHFILREFMRVRDQYLGLINVFAAEHKASTQEDVNYWHNITIQAFDRIILHFSEIMHVTTTNRLKAQQQMINELSSPVIALENKKALLPLVGDIDTDRAKQIIENTLEQCTLLEINQLFVDLSGVVMIDTMVANQIFKLIDALGLLGVECTLSGIRPEIAITAVQLGLSFDQITVQTTLAQALEIHS